MKAAGMRSAVICLGLLFTVFVLPGLISTVRAADAKDLLNMINKELRQANRDMFGGKMEKAVAALEPIKEKLIQAKQADPGSPKIATYENRYKKLVKDLERRTGKNLGGGTLTATVESSSTQLPPKPETDAMPVKSDAAKAPEKIDAGAQPAMSAPQTVQKKDAASPKLPFNARRYIHNAGNDLARIESALEKLKNPKWNKDQLLKNMDTSL